MGEKFLNEVKNEEKNEKIFHEFWNLHYPPFLVKDLYKDNQKNDKIVKNINESLINLRNSINGKNIPERENPKKNSQYCWKNPWIFEQQKFKGFKMSTLK